MRIILVEDDEAQSQVAVAALERAKINVKCFGSGEAGMRGIAKSPPTLVILARRLPDIDSLDVLIWIRRQLPDLPIIMLTSATREAEAVEALNAGADFYLYKPVGGQELVARVHALVRRSREATKYRDVIEIGPYVIDSLAMAVKLNGRPIALAPKEYDIMELLARNIGRVVSRDMVLARIWGKALGQPSPRTLDTYVYRLKQKLSLHTDTQVVLRVLYAHGYRLEYFGAPLKATQAQIALAR